MTIKTAPMASGASGLPLATAAPTVNTRKNVPIASTVYRTPTRGMLTTSSVSLRNSASLAVDDVTMAPRLALAGHEVVNAGGQDPSPPPLLRAYRPAVNAPVRCVCRVAWRDNFHPNP